MKLPEIQTPTYNITLPVSKKNIKFRPYLVKEHKILLMSSDGDDLNLTEGVLQILRNCILTEDIDLLELPQIDVEFYFYNLRARSQSEIVETRYRCKNLIEDKECKNIMEYDLNLLTDLEITEIIDSPIELTDSVGIKISYPKFKSKIKHLDKPKSKDILDIIIDSIEYIYDEHSKYKPEDTSEEELLKFVENLSLAQLEKIEDYLKQSPKIIKKIDITCAKCGFEHKIIIDDIFDFFD